MNENRKPNGNEPLDNPRQHARRRLLKALGGAGGAFAAGRSLPEHWTRPAVDAVLLPAHAQATGTGPWSGNGTATLLGPGPAKGVGDRLLDAVIPPANAGAKDDGGPFCFDIYVCIEMVDTAKAKVRIFDCCGPSTSSTCTLSGGNKINGCNVNGYTVYAELKNNKWEGTAEGECCFLDEGANTDQGSPFDPQRKLLAENRTPGMAGQLLDALVPTAQAGDDAGMLGVWEFTLTQGGCRSQDLECPATPS